MEIEEHSIEEQAKVYYNLLAEDDKTTPDQIASLIKKNNKDKDVMSIIQAMFSLNATELYTYPILPILFNPLIFIISELVVGYFFKKISVYSKKSSHQIEITTEKRDSMAELIKCVEEKIRSKKDELA